MLRLGLYLSQSTLLCLKANRFTKGGIQKVAIVSLTPAAQQEIKKRLTDKSGQGIRLGVKGGGCSGFSYLIEVGEPRPNDQVDDSHGFAVFIDPKSSLYLKDCTLDFEDGFMGSGFKFKNPNASNTCGCGESFSL